jgi:hypothetical protein
MLANLCPGDMEGPDSSRLRAMFPACAINQGSVPDNLSLSGRFCNEEMK